MYKRAELLPLVDFFVLCGKFVCVVEHSDQFVLQLGVRHAMTQACQRIRQLPEIVRGRDIKRQIMPLNSSPPSTRTAVQPCLRRPHAGDRRKGAHRLRAQRRGVLRCSPSKQRERDNISALPGPILLLLLAIEQRLWAFVVTHVSRLPSACTVARRHRDT